MIFPRIYTLAALLLAVAAQTPSSFQHCEAGCPQGYQIFKPASDQSNHSPSSCYGGCYNAQGERKSRSSGNVRPDPHAQSQQHSMSSSSSSAGGAKKEKNCAGAGKGMVLNPYDGKCRQPPKECPPKNCAGAGAGMVQDVMDCKCKKSIA